MLSITYCVSDFVNNLMATDKPNFGQGNGHLDPSKKDIQIFTWMPA